MRLDMTIREATLVDQPEINRMAADFYESSIYKAAFGWSLDAVATLVVAALTRGVVFVAEAMAPPLQEIGAFDPEKAKQLEPTIVGMIALFEFPHPISGEPYSEEIAMWVDPPFRGNLGPKMLGVAELWARQKGLSMLKMTQPHGSPAVGRLYERAGYQPLETTWIKRLE